MQLLLHLLLAVYDNFFKTIEVSAISVEQCSFNLFIGDEAVITAKALPDNTTESKNITYSISDESIVTIDGTGKLTAVGVGQCKVTIISEADISVTAVIDVKVSPIPVSEINVNETLTIKEEEKKTLEAEVNENATDKTLTFKSSDNSIATVNAKGDVKGVKEGDCTITVSSNDGKITKTVKVTVDDKFGVEECEPYTMYSIGGNLYSGPGTSYDKICWQGENVEVTVLGKAADSNWYKVEIDGVEGFMGGTQLQSEKIVYQSSSSGEDSYDYYYDSGSDSSSSDSSSSDSDSSNESSLGWDALLDLPVIEQDASNFGNGDPSDLDLSWGN